MSKTWFKLTVVCPHCGTMNRKRIWKNCPPLCDKCGEPMNTMENWG